MPNKKRCLNDEQIAFLIAEYQGGRAAAEIATDLRVSKSSAVAYLKNAGIELRGPTGAPKLVTREVAEEAKTLHERGSLWKQISARMNLSISALQNAVYKLRREECD